MGDKIYTTLFNYYFEDVDNWKIDRIFDEKKVSVFLWYKGGLIGRSETSEPEKTRDETLEKLYTNIIDLIIKNGVMSVIEFNKKLKS